MHARRAWAIVRLARAYSSEAQAARISRWRKVALFGAAGTATVLGFTTIQLYVSTTRAISDTSIPGPKTQDELTKIYNDTADGFDAEVNISERLMGVTRARKRLAAQAKGHVLEVSCGTARNLGYYIFDPRDGGQGVKSLTLADLSVQMVECGKKKWYALKDGNGLMGDIKGVPVRFWHGDVKGEMPPPPVDSATGRQARGYDTIIQSMGLCSTDEPVELLKNLASYLDKDNPEARILLLEHGRSYIQWWNGVLDSQAAMHASKHGCWWNRDIGQIVEASGLEVVKERRQNFGTTWIFELKNEAEVQQPRVQPQLKEPSQEASVTKSWADWLPRWTYEKICKR